MICEVRALPAVLFSFILPVCLASFRSELSLKLSFDVIHFLCPGSEHSAAAASSPSSSLARSGIHQAATKDSAAAALSTESASSSSSSSFDFAITGAGRIAKPVQIPLPARFESAPATTTAADASSSSSSAAPSSSALFSLEGPFAWIEFAGLFSASSGTQFIFPFCVQSVSISQSCVHV